MKITKIRMCFFIMLLLLINCQKSKNPLSAMPEEGYWEIISSINNGLNKIFFVDSKNGWAVGDNGKIIYSDNGGKTWQNQNSGTNNKLISIFFIDNKKGFATGYNNTLLYTNDGGNIWNLHNIQSDSSTIYSSIHSDNNNNIWFISNYGEIFFSTNFGQDWSYKYGFNRWGYSYLYFPSNAFGFAMQFHGNELKKTTDGGEIWNTYQLPTQWTGDIYFLNDSYGWFTEDWAPSSAIHDSASIYITTNGGETWIRQTSLSGFSLDNVKFMNIDNGWLSEVTKIYHTTNGGKLWDCQFENKNIGFIKDIYFLNNSNGWALASQGDILKYNIR